MPPIISYDEVERRGKWGHQQTMQEAHCDCVLYLHCGALLPKITLFA